MNNQSISEIFTPSDKYSFQDNIDLWDETLREGAERSPISPTIEDKVKIAIELSNIGSKSIVVGMFPDVPHNIELLAQLMDTQKSGEIKSDVRFIVISHVGITFDQTVCALESLNRDLSSVWVLCIHSVSDVQIKHLFPTVLLKDPNQDLDVSGWIDMSSQERYQINCEWFDSFIPKTKSFTGGGVAFGLLDYFRSDLNHSKNIISILNKHDAKQIRLVDAAGSCTPHQLGPFIGDVISDYPDIYFYGHFHNDFGLATSNALVGLSMGLKGVDVSIGGFANRAGHPPLAEVASSLYYLYGQKLPGFDYAALTSISRKVENLYGLMESPCTPVTGVITHGVLTGIRTQLQKMAPTIFDVLEPTFVGANLSKMYGVRSGRDGMKRYLEAFSSTLGVELQITDSLVDNIFEIVQAEWNRRSNDLKTKLKSNIEDQHKLLKQATFTENQMKDYILNELSVNIINTHGQ